MDIIGFVGKSGTGKSTKALEVAKKEGCGHILDDGLLIDANKRTIVAGANVYVNKNLDNDIDTTIMIALLSFNMSHTREIRQELSSNNSVLILGTSKEMVELIVKNLELPNENIQKFVNIEEVSTSKEIDEALYARMQRKFALPVYVKEVVEAYRTFQFCIPK